jgi:iron(III) transport system substrate-binding protein
LVIYTSQDVVFAAPILRQFERETGIAVRAAYDSEAVKTVGLANRLWAERHRAQCDVFWSNEEMRMRQLGARGLFEENAGWEAFGYRSRRVVVNTNLVAASHAPARLADLTNAAWHGRVALAYPLFGTTATHFMVLRQHWGRDRWRAWCQALAANKPLLVDGNSVVVRMVGSGAAAVGLTDSDDIAAGRHHGYPIAALPLNDESLLIPNTVGRLRGRPAAGDDARRRLVAFLSSPAVVGRLIGSNALEGASVAAVATPTLLPDWPAVLRDLDSATEELSAIFLRRP